MSETEVNVYHSNHDLRATFSRENTELRRTNGATLRRFLTGKQDKQCLNRFTQIRDEYEVTNNNDVVVVYCLQLIDEGKQDELDPRLVQIVQNYRVLQRRSTD